MNHTGIILLYKQPSVTSFRSLYAIKRNICRKVGHTGTLDRFAEGLLVALVGSMTKMNNFFSELDKVYEATFLLGKQTDTLDPEGTVVKEGPVPEYEQISAAIKKFIGKIEQRPPKFSAVHVNGIRAYKATLQGQQIELKPRPVEIYSIDILEWNSPELKLRIHCSKGTYIRSLARDLGESLSTCAYVTELKRTKVGPFSIDHAKIPEMIEPTDIITGWACFESIGQFSKCIVKDSYVRKIQCGSLLQPHWCEHIEYNTDSKFCVIYTEDHKLLGLAEIQEDPLQTITFTKYKFVVPAG